jgi:hypothetical protein
MGLKSLVDVGIIRVWFSKGRQKIAGTAQSNLDIQWYGEVILIHSQVALVALVALVACSFFLERCGGRATEVTTWARWPLVLGSIPWVDPKLLAVLGGTTNKRSMPEVGVRTAKFSWRLAYLRSLDCFLMLLSSWICDSLRRCRNEGVSGGGSLILVKRVSNSPIYPYPILEYFG